MALCLTWVLSCMDEFVLFDSSEGKRCYPILLGAFNFGEGPYLGAMVRCPHMFGFMEEVFFFFLGNLVFISFSTIQGW